MQKLKLLACFFGFMLLSQSAFGATATTNAEVTNTAPVASAILLNGGSDLTLTANETTAITATLTVTDDNGCEDIIGVNSTLFRTPTGSSAADDNRTHYSAVCVSNADCVAGGGDLTETFDCNFAISWYADPTDVGSLYEGDEWTLEVEPYDSETSTTDTATQEMLTLTAMSLETSAINFGEIALGGDTGAVNQATVIANHGNEALDIELSGYGAAPADGSCMICSIGDVTVSYLEYGSLAFAYGAGTALSDAATELDLDLDRGSEAGERPTASVYYGLGFPASGLSGTCTGTLVITAVSDPSLD